MAFSFSNKLNPPPPRTPLVSSVQKPYPQQLSLSLKRSSSINYDAAYPSLAFSNTLFFKSGYNVQVIVGDNEPEDRLIGRFRREVLRAHVIQESKRRRFFETSQEKRKRKTREAAKRNRKRPRTSNTATSASASASASASSKKEAQECDDDDDNWEWIDMENLPYC